jgi:hypothetical protein
MVYLSGRSEDFVQTDVDHVDAKHRLRFMLAYVALLRHIGVSPTLGTREVSDNFSFYDFRPYRRSAKAFAASFLVSHPLLLRTARHYLKSSMLSRTDGMAEDALTNLLFALEGCLLLFQEIEGVSTKRLNRKVLRTVFARRYVHGESTYEFIEDAMGWGGMRAQLVHPQLALTDGWTPALMTDDYYEYHQVTRALLTFLVTGTTHDEYELVSP